MINIVVTFNKIDQHYVVVLKVTMIQNLHQTELSEGPNN